ncbi:MAG TPA: sulfatase-like hydrolase/transferase [Limnobacter sp.]|nr:sulfatase-like hydrolase/transferase [Limnobacter sp.]
MSSTPASLPPTIAPAALPAQEKIKGWLLARLAIAVLLLNSSLCFTAIWPTVYIQPSPSLSPEFACLLVLLAAVCVLFGKPSARALGWLAALLALMVVGRYANVVVPNILGRPVNLYWDVPEIPRFAWVTAQGLPWWTSAMAVMGGLLGAWALHRVLWWALKTLSEGMAPVSRSPALWAVLLLLGGLGLTGFKKDHPPNQLVSQPVLTVYVKELQKLLDIVVPSRAAKLLPPSTVIDQAMASQPGEPLAALAGRDFTLVFLETYGAVLYDQPQARQAVQATRDELERAIVGGGKQVVSAFFTSPTIGGASDLAHLSVLSGIDLKDSRKHDVLLTTNRPTLIDVFQREGYEAFGLYHSVGWDWAERVYYGFDQYLSGPDLGYPGPPIGFWKIPDQYALPRLEQLHPRNPQAKPRFTLFTTISTHFPFHQVPPYQQDWQKLLSEQPFDADAAAKAQAEPVLWEDMRPDYYRSINYAHTWLAGYFTQPEPRPTVYVLVGDHQPTGSVSREDTPWDVPVFVVSNDKALIQRFRAMGFSEGLTPVQRAPMGGLHDLTTVLLKGFGSALPQ